MKLIAILILILFCIEAEAAVHLLKGNLIEKRRFQLGSSTFELVFDSRSLNQGPWGFGWCSNLEPDCVQYYNLGPFTGVHPTSTTSSSGKFLTLHTSQGEWIRLSFSQENLVRVEQMNGFNEKYHYDEWHNLTRLVYSDQTEKRIEYDAEQDVVLSVRGRSTCFEKYIYTHKESHLTSTTVHRYCSDEKPKILKYDFTYKISLAEEDRLLKLNVISL